MTGRPSWSASCDHQRGHFATLVEPAFANDAGYGPLTRSSGHSLGIHLRLGRHAGHQAQALRIRIHGRSARSSRPRAGSPQIVLSLRAAGKRTPGPDAPGTCRRGRASQGVLLADRVLWTKGPFRVCAVRRRRSPVGARPTRQIAPAGSNRSGHGGNEMAEAFG